MLNRFGRLSYIALPVIPVLEEAEKKIIQPVSCIDFAMGILASVTSKEAIGKSYVLSFILFCWL